MTQSVAAICCNLCCEGNSWSYSWNIFVHKSVDKNSNIFINKQTTCQTIYNLWQGGRSCAKARRVFAEKFGLRRKFYALTYAICRHVNICHNLCTFWKSVGKVFFFGQKQCFLGKKYTIKWYILRIILIMKGCQLLPPWSVAWLCKVAASCLQGWARMNFGSSGITEATKKTSCRNIDIRVQKLSYSINIQWIRNSNLECKTTYTGRPEATRRPGHSIVPAPLRKREGRTKE